MPLLWGSNDFLIGSVFTMFNANSDDLAPYFQSEMELEWFDQTLDCHGSRILERLALL